MSEFKILSDREHILLRPAIYIGAIDKTEVSDFCFERGEFSKFIISPALVKIINEIIDNSLDEAIKTNFEFANKIEIQINSEFFSVKDNGRGIPVEKYDGFFKPYLCWAQAKTGSNFDDNNRKSLGMNGVGSACTNIFSKKFIGITDDGKNHYSVEFRNNNSEFIENITKSKKQGTVVTSYPDLEKFGVVEIESDIIRFIKNRILSLSVIFPKIQFIFNNEKINFKNFKDFMKNFSENPIIYENENVSIGVFNGDDFRQFSYVNGLKINDGGIHIDLISNEISNQIRDKLSKKFKTIKPADIKNKINLVVIINNFINPKFNSQTKEKLTNSIKEFNDFAKIDYSFIQKIIKNPDIMDPIIETFLLKEKVKEKCELKILERNKKVKSEKYTPAINDKKMLMICEGYSAMSGIQRCLGRNGIGYYELKGKILNVCDITGKKFTENRELSELYQIINSENYEKIIITSDADLDGTSIAGLLLNYFRKYHLELLKNSRIFRLNTPVAISIEKGEITDWCYSLKDIGKLKNEIQYMKGLGSWEHKKLKKIIEKDGLERMLMCFEYSDEDEKTLDEWYKNDGVEFRKIKIIENDFNLIKL